MAGMTLAPVWAVVVGGMAAALHVGKLPPALPALEHSLGLGLVAAGFLLSLVQAAGMVLGLAAGLVADTLGLRRCMLMGLALLTLAGAAGGLQVPVVDPVTWLLACRVLEGVGFLLTVMPAPGLIRRLAPPGTEKRALGLWGAYMPGGVALALLLGPWLISSGGWRFWWWGVAGLSALAWVLIAGMVAPDSRLPAKVHDSGAWRYKLGTTLGAAGPWNAALAFGLYSAQWISVIGFLPTVYVQAGLAVGVTALLTALAAGLNVVGNVVAGRLLQAGWPPLRLLCIGFGCMVLGSVAAFAQVQGSGLPPTLRYLAVCLFSMGGGAVPATLFMLSVRVAPGPQTVSTTVGWMQQVSSLGQFCAPPLVGWLAHRAGGWQWTWLFTLGCSVLGILAALRLRRAAEGAA